MEKKQFKNYIKNTDWILLISICLMSAIGIALLYSAGQSKIDPWASKQLYTCLIFIPIMFLASLVNTGFFYKYAFHWYFLGLALLIIAEITGHKAMGAQRWIRIGFINFQPSEFMKIFVILALARCFHRIQLRDIGNALNLFFPLIIVILPTVLILKQPNLGTSLIIILISASIFFCAGVRIWKFISLIFVSLLSIPIIWSLMHAYQKKRVFTFLNPESDPLGAGYNIIQSLIAIGSGETFGKGYLEGSQSHLNFLPEKQTDFIFTILAEEFGFAGVIVVFLLGYLIIARSFIIALSCKNQFSRLVIIGVSSMFIFHIIINSAMIAGLIPVVGTPFPLLSYGGSNLITILMGFGIVLSAANFKNSKLNNNINFEKYV